MKAHNIVIMFVGCFLAFFLIYSYQNQAAVEYSNQNIKYANMLTTACYGAAHTINTDYIGTKNGAWDKKQYRVKTLNVFYETLAENLNKEEFERQSLEEYTPFVILLDNTGFYINYNACYDRYGNSVTPPDISKIGVLSDINTYTANYASGIPNKDIVVRYYLNDFIDIFAADGSFYSGKKDEVYAELDYHTQEALSFLKDEATYNSMKRDAVVKKVEDVINYYLNTQSIKTSEYNTGYSVTIPLSEGEYWARTLKHPTIISFAQGEQEWMDDNILNVYAYASGEINGGYYYFIRDGYYYRLDEDSPVEKKYVDGKQIYLFEGTPIENFYASSYDCAKRGAVPSSFLIR